MIADSNHASHSVAIVTVYLLIRPSYIGQDSEARVVDWTVIKIPPS